MRAAGTHSRRRAVVALGAVVGALAGRLRRASSDSERFWNLSTELLCTSGRDGIFRRVNPAWERTLGWSAEELCSRPFLDFVHEEDRQRTMREFERLLTQGNHTLVFENRYRCKDGGHRTLLWGARSIVEVDGLIYAAARDITDRKAAEHRREAARAEAERATRAKTEFLSRMSHELRTPLNAITGFAELLSQDGLDERQDEAIEQILGAARHLRALVDELLDISRIEAGTMALSLAPVEIGGVLRESVSLIGPLADTVSVRVVYEDGAHPATRVLADRQRLVQVLVNLLGNAVKYNRPGGEVRVGCREPAAGLVEIVVSDTGRGIGADRLSGLFAPFDRLGAESSGIDGTGLGLSLSSAFVEAMGGTITGESEEGTGTTMRVRLRAAPAGDSTEDDRR